MSYIPTTKLKGGIELCDRNAKSLLEGARVLLEKGSFGHSLGLAILSMEEYAKKLILVAKSIYPKRFEKDVGPKCDALKHLNVIIVK